MDYIEIYETGFSPQQCISSAVSERTKVPASETYEQPVPALALVCVLNTEDVVGVLRTL